MTCEIIDFDFPILPNGHTYFAKCEECHNAVTLTTRQVSNIDWTMSKCPCGGRVIASKTNQRDFETKSASLQLYKQPIAFPTKPRLVTIKTVALDQAKYKIACTGCNKAKYQRGFSTCGCGGKFTIVKVK